MYGERKTDGWHNVLVLVALLSLLAICAQSCRAGELWVDDGFKLEWAGWLDSELIPDWTGLRCGLTLPPGGWLTIQGTGAVEVLIPGRGWVRDKGILVVDGCTPNMNTDLDTAAPGVVVITEDLKCSKHGDRVLLLVRLPKMLKHVGPTQARWVAREVQYAKAR